MRDIYIILMNQEPKSSCFSTTRKFFCLYTVYLIVAISNSRTSIAFSYSPTSVSVALMTKFIIHSALDRFDELIKPEFMKLRPTIGSNSMYIGLLGCYDELMVYGMFWVYFLFFHTACTVIYHFMLLRTPYCYICY